MPERAEAVTFDAVAMAEGLVRGLERSSAGRSADPLERAMGLADAIRALQLLVLDRLGTVREQFPATNQALMATPEAPVAPERDALAHAADFLAPIDVLDLLSAPGLPCVAPHLHRGWQDRTRSCQHAREVATAVVGLAVGAEERARLMSGLAIVNRVFMLPPPVRLDAAEVGAMYGPVLRLIERLAGSAHAGFADLEKRILGG